MDKLDRKFIGGEFNYLKGIDKKYLYGGGALAVIILAIILYFIFRKPKEEKEEKETYLGITQTNPYAQYPLHGYQYTGADDDISWSKIMSDRIRTPKKKV